PGAGIGSFRQPQRADRPAHALRGLPHVAGRKAGQGEPMKPTLRHVSPIPFFGSAAIALVLIALAAGSPDRAAAMFDAANAWIIAEAGWFYLLSVGIFVIFLLGLAFSPYGRIKLGPDDSQPDYGFGTWVAMLFSGGMGIGIVFYGVAEPITHFASPP